MLYILKSLILFLAITLIILLSFFIKTAKAEDAYAQDVIAQIYSGYDQIKNSSCSENKKDGFYIFVSFSMSKTLLEAHDQIAKQIGAKLVLRGFKNNSFKETSDYIKEISAEGVSIEIDPVAFKKFSITAVPSFILSDGDKFDKVLGNVSIPYVLEQFRTLGDVKQKASEYLARLK